MLRMATILPSRVIALHVLLAASAACLGSAAHAADNGIYVGFSGAQMSADYDTRLPSIPVSVDEGNGFKVIGGFRPLDPLAIEINYVDLGETNVSADGGACLLEFPTCPNAARIDTRAASLAAIGHLSLSNVDLFGRVGVARWQSKIKYVRGPARPERGTDLTYGAGVQFRLGSIALRLEYERFELSDDSTDSASLGFTYTFF